MSISKRFNEIRQILPNSKSRGVLDIYEERYFVALENLEKEFNVKLDLLEQNIHHVPDLKEALIKCLLSGEKWPGLQERIKTMYFEMAVEKFKNHKTAARQIGISRTTIGEHFRRVKKQKTKEIEK